jgi:hypothetical protein
MQTRSTLGGMPRAGKNFFLVFYFRRTFSFRITLLTNRQRIRLAIFGRPTSCFSPSGGILSLRREMAEAISD